MGGGGGGGGYDGFILSYLNVVPLSPFSVTSQGKTTGYYLVFSISCKEKLD